MIDTVRNMTSATAAPSIIETFEGRRVLVTGHTGFKGSWLTTWLLDLGADVTGLAQPPEHERGLFVSGKIADRMVGSHYGDIRDPETVYDLFRSVEPEIVFHLAAQAIVRESYLTPVETFETNVMGTVHVLEAIRRTSSVRAAVMVTSDKCYENPETSRGLREGDPMGGHDPYSASKACAELAVSSYRQSFLREPDGPRVASVRAGNVIGGGDWADDRIMPDCVHALERGESIRVRNPLSVRPWTHVLEPLGGYLSLAARLLAEPDGFDGAWNFGPEKADFADVRTLVEHVLDAWGDGTWEDVSDVDALHEAVLLYLDVSKVRDHLGWRPVLSLKEAVRMTVDWYRRARVDDPYSLTISQIREYIDAAQAAGRSL